MADDETDDLEILAVTLVDLRATVDSMKRLITHAHSSVGQYRHTHGQELLADIADCLIQLKTELDVIFEGSLEASKPLRRLNGYT